MANPFADWREDQQSRNHHAIDKDGKPVSRHDPTAAKFTAVNWLRLKGIDYDERQEFTDFLRSRDERRRGLIGLNEDDWTPAQFRDAWDRFEASRQ